jgi:taurine transport system permease protein
MSEAVQINHLPATTARVQPKATAPQASGPVKTSRFKTPGEGSSLGISIVTVALLLALWFAATNLGWIKPLFLPSPQAVFQQFYEYLTGQANDKPLWQHFSASLLRVTVAFWLAFMIAVPLGIAMGMSRFARGIFDPPSSSTAPCRHWPICR